jgi:hypothetical protein
MARPTFEPTDEQRRLVKSLAAYGMKYDAIARRLGIRSTKTLAKHFREELDSGDTEANAQVAQTLFQMAISGEQPASTMFWLKTRAGWRETPPPQRDHLVKFKLLNVNTAAEIASALAGVLRDVADGLLTPADGERIAALLEGMRKTLQTENHEARLRALESRPGGATDGKIIPLDLDSASTPPEDETNGPQRD